MSRTILVLHGPNLNLLGAREPQHYGQESLDSVNQSLLNLTNSAAYPLETLQSNAEHELIDRVHACLHDGTQFIVINPAGLTHTSVVLRDALAAIQLPFIEVHLSNIYAREPFRQHSYFSDCALGVISGLGTHGYRLAVMHAIEYLNTHLIH